MSQDMCHLTQQHVVRMLVQVAFVLPFCADFPRLQPQNTAVKGPKQTNKFWANWSFGCI